jgi:plastocyanin
MKKVYKVALLIPALCFVLVSTGIATTHIINTEDFEFNPSNLTVNVGDSIVWIWDRGVHTTTSTNIPAGAAFWAAPVDQSNLLFTYVVTVPGSYDYQCDYHVTMGMTGHFDAIGTTSAGSAFAAFPVELRGAGNGRLTVAYAGGLSGWSIEIMSMTGSIVRKFVPDNRTSPVTENYFIGDLPAGIYIVRIYNGELMHAERIIKE